MDVQAGPSNHEIDHCLFDTNNILARQLAEEMCSPKPKTYPPEVFDTFASAYVKARRSNNGKEYPSFTKLANDIDSIRSTLDLPDQPTSLNETSLDFHATTYKAPFLQLMMDHILNTSLEQLPVKTY